MEPKSGLEVDGLGVETVDIMEEDGNFVMTESVVRELS